MADHTITFDATQEAAVAAEAARLGVTTAQLVQAEAVKGAEAARLRVYNNWWTALSTDDKQTIYEANNA